MGTMNERETYDRAVEMGGDRFSDIYDAIVEMMECFSDAEMPEAVDVIRRSLNDVMDGWIKK